MASAAIEVAGIVKRYGDKTAVAGVTFTVDQGEIFGLLGPNGAGKSTTISILSTLLDWDAGEVKIGGFDLQQDKRRIQQIIGFVPQDLAIYPALSARDNLIFIGRIYGLSGTALRRRAYEVLELVGLADRADQESDTFSGGMKRRLNIGAGLMHRPRILFLDEPTVGVDPQSRNFIFEHIEKLNAEGMTILYTTHYMEEAERLCNRVAIVDNGKILAVDSVQGLIRLAGGGVIYLGVPPEFAALTQMHMQQVKSIRSTLTADGQMKIETNNLNQELLEVIALCKDQNVPILSLELLRPNLETVFLQLTGKRLRE
jgi:ABC-2 type transport system ATP-binding protein